MTYCERQFSHYRDGVKERIVRNFYSYFIFIVVAIAICLFQSQSRGSEVYRIDSPVSGLAVQADQRILIAGYGAYILSVNEATGTISRHRGGVFRLQQNGSLDESFFCTMSAMNYLKLLPDERVLVHGCASEPKSMISGANVILLPDGGVDPSFVLFRDSSNGVPHFPLNWWPYSSLYPVAVDSKHCIVMPPLRDDRIPPAPFARFDATGKLMPLPSGNFPDALRFGNGFAAPRNSDRGAVAALFRNTFTNFPIELCRNAFPLPDGSTLLLTDERDGNRLRRIKGDGEEDETFGCKIRFSKLPVSSFSLAAQGDGKFVVAGNLTEINGIATTGIARLMSDGSVDHSFQCSLEEGKKNWGDHNVQIGLQKDGRIVIGGFFEKVNSISCHYLARLNINGSLDTDFQAHFIAGEDYRGSTFPVVSLSTRATTTKSPSIGGNSNRASTVFISSLDVNPGGTATIRYVGNPQQVYILQASDSLHQSIWNNVATNRTDSTGNGLIAEQTAAPLPLRFYRIAQP